MEKNFFIIFEMTTIRRELDNIIAENLTRIWHFEVLVFQTYKLFGNIYYLMILTNKLCIIALL